MKKSPAQHKPSFLWQGVLILAPAAILLIAGIWSLRIDRAAVLNEAREKAESVAGSVLGALERFIDESRPTGGGTLPVSIAGRMFVVDSSNRLVGVNPACWPPEPVPVQPAAAHLSGTELQWTEAEKAFDAAEYQRAAELWSELASQLAHVSQQSEPASGSNDFTARLRSVAMFRCGQAFERLGRTNEAIRAYKDVITLLTDARESRSESGVPLTHLAGMKMLDLLGHDGFTLAESDLEFWAMAIPVLTREGSPYGDALLHRLRVLLAASTARMRDALDPLMANWEQYNLSRKLYAEAVDEHGLGSSPWPDFFWVNVGGHRWFAVAQKAAPVDSAASGATRKFVALPESELVGMLRKSAAAVDPQTKFNFSVEVCGEVLDVDGTGKNAVSGPQPSFTARSKLLAAAVTATLRDLKQFSAAQRRRQWTFSGLLLVSAATCVVGFISARNAFRRQQRLAEMKSNFVSSVSHELRAPVASLRLMAESLECGRITDREKQSEYFRFIARECRRLSALIENVLDFSRIEQGRKKYEFEPTDLAALVTDTVKLMEPCAAEKGVLLKSEIRSRGTEVELDGQAIQQALVNLIDNAIKHSPKGETVTIALESRESVWDRQTGVDNKRRGQTAPSIMLTVTDHGPGIPAYEHEKIFERFYRCGSELRRETQGVGIGLSIVKHIVEAHNGRIWVESELGKGSRFVIELPLIR